MKNKRVLYILVIFGLIIIAGYALFVFTRFSNHTLYVPFSGRIFDLDSDVLQSVWIQSGTTGDIISYSEPDDIEDITRVLNDAKYRYFLPTIPIGSSGWSYRIVIQYGNAGQEYDYYFTEDSITVRGVVYYLKGDGLRTLTSALLVNK